MAKDLNIDPNIIKKNKIPPLIKDKKWLELYNDNLTKEMRKMMEELEKLINEEKESHKELKNCKKQKKYLMDQILKLSDDANTNNNNIAIVKLEQAKNKVLEINDKIDELQFRLEMLPKEIENKNLELLKETIIISYKYIKDDRKKVKYLDEEVQKLRKQLGEMFEEKFTKERRLNNLYHYLHDTLGHQETDKMDRKFL